MPVYADLTRPEEKNKIEPNEVGVVNNFIRERATESKTTHLLQHIGQ